VPESDNNLRLEIGHVLFIDIVGYSKLLNEEQKEQRVMGDRRWRSAEVES